MTMVMDAYATALMIATLSAQRDEIDAQIAELKDAFRGTETQVYVDETSSGRPALLVKVSPNTRMDDRLAREVLDEATYETVSKTVLDTAKARAFLTAQQIKDITKVYDNKVEVQVK